MHLYTFPPQMRRDARHEARHAGGMILTEYGLRFAKDGDHWRCVEYPALLMLWGERYRVGGRTSTTLCEAVRQVKGGACFGRGFISDTFGGRSRNASGRPALAPKAQFTGCAFSLISNPRRVG